MIPINGCGCMLCRHLCQAVMESSQKNRGSGIRLLHQNLNHPLMDEFQAWVVYFSGTDPQTKQGLLSSSHLLGLLDL